MRYQNWDVLLFPGSSKVPMQEFKTACHAVHDHESSCQLKTPMALPTVTSFTPSLPAGAPFQVSIHSWYDPEPSSYSRSGGRSLEDIRFEARVFLDGKLESLKVFAADGPWPAILSTSIEQKRDNEMEPLQFPLFHRELLVQNFWNAGDQLGRVRVLISEGYLTSSKRFERIKNIIAFSFQHAPLEILESSAIAWPNPGMWQQAQIHAQYLAATMLPSTTAARDLGDHAHSPRDKGSSSRTRLPSLGGNATYSSYAEDYPRISDVLFDSALGWRRTSGTDVSMPDYSSCGSNANESRRTTNPTGEAETGTTLQSAGAFGTMCDRLLTPAAEKSPKDVKISIKRSASVEAQIHDRKTGATSPSPDPVLEARLRIPKTRKENTRQCPVIITSPAPAEPSRDDAQPPVITRSGTKRPRLATPKAFDEMGEENEPTISPTRKASQAMTRPVGTRRVLSTVEYNIR